MIEKRGALWLKLVLASSRGCMMPLESNRYQGPTTGRKKKKIKERIESELSIDNKELIALFGYLRTLISVVTDAHVPLHPRISSRGCFDTKRTSHRKEPKGMSMLEGRCDRRESTAVTGQGTYFLDPPY